MEDKKETTETPQDTEAAEALSKNEEAVVEVPHAIVIANSMPHGQDGR